MLEIILKVTSNSLKQVKKEGKWHQAQIAIATPKFQATSKNRQAILIGGAIKLTVGDSHAIWHSHNTNPEQQKNDFEKLFMLLANHPDEKVQFSYNLLK